MLLKVKQPSADYKLFAPDSFTQLLIVDVNESKLHVLLLFGVLIVELHLSQQELSIIIVLYFKITSFRHIAYDFCRAASAFGCLVDRNPSPLSGFISSILRC